MDALANLLRQLAEMMCGLRDDLYNHAVLTNPEAFAAGLALSGSRSFTTAQMPPASGAVAHKAHENTTKDTVIVFVRADPVVLDTAPATTEEVVLLVSVAGAGEPDTVRTTPVMKASKGTTQAVLLRPNQILKVSVVASATVNVSWRVMPLRGRRNVFAE